MWMQFHFFPLEIKNPFAIINYVILNPLRIYHSNQAAIQIIRANVGGSLECMSIMGGVSVGLEKCIYGPGMRKNVWSL